MKMIALLLIAIVSLSASFIYRNGRIAGQTNASIARQQVLKKKQLNLFYCSPDLSAIDFADSLNRIPLLTGWGNYEMPVTSGSDSARIYFEQGINMYYGFHIIESLASFEKAVQFEPGFAMAWWGKALAYGPNINDLGYAASPEALAAIGKAKELCNGCTAIEKALIDAMQVRYSADTALSRAYLDQLYADAMKQVYMQFSNSADAAALYADALMVQHPWDLYDTYGKPKSWTPEIVSTLEELLNRSPAHPGGSHYYIHAIEGSDHPEKGLTVAKQLPELMPGVAHLVHMPSHIYIRAGYYNEGVIVNEQAVKGYYQTLGNYAPVINNSVLYLVHNLHMQATCANMDGRFMDALKASKDCAESFDSSYMDLGGYLGAYMQYIYMTPFLTLIRFGKWDQILNSPEIPASRVYANLIWHYGRGLAYARRKDFDRADEQLEFMRQAMKVDQLLESPPAFNPAIAGSKVAEKILEGVIAEEKDDISTAIGLFRDAVINEDAMKYNEPKDWVHPARQYLGDALIKAGKDKEAEKVYNQDLLLNPNNGWSLTGLAIALRLQNKIDRSKQVQSKAKKALERSDVAISGSVF